MPQLNRQLLEQVLASPRLPTLPRIAMEVVDMCRDDDATVNDLAKLISQDPALVMKLLQTVNTSGFGLGRSVGTVEEATKMLGLKAIQTLALAFCLANSMTDQCGDAFDMEVYWRRCVYSASASQEVARKTKCIDPQEAFVLGLLQDIGVLAMAMTIGRPYLQITKVAGKNHSALDRFERSNLAVSHAVVGAMLAQRWKLGPTLVNAIRYHQEPDTAPEEYKAVAWCACLGSLAADLLLPDQFAMSTSARWFEQAHKSFGVRQYTGNQILEDAEAHGRTIAGSFNLAPRAKRDMHQILSDANQRLAELAIAHQLSAEKLQVESEQLRRRADRDALTGLANRQMFDRVLDEQLALLQPVALVLIDLDRFKSVNDTHGHLAGDAVLRCQGQLMEDLTPTGCLAARYGGEEFALILPATNLKEATQLAEGIRAARIGRPVDIGSSSLDVTLSAGIAIRMPGDPSTPQELIHRADQALYAAKTAGRNRVKINHNAGSDDENVTRSPKPDATLNKRHALTAPPQPSAPAA